MAKAEHQCPVCDKTFSRAQHTVRHLRTHTGEKPYVCRICNEDFQRADMLTRHRTKSHAQDEVHQLALSQADRLPHQHAHPDRLPSRPGPSTADGKTGQRYERRSKYTVMATELAREIEEGTSRRDAEQSQAGFAARVPSTYAPPTGQPIYPPLPNVPPSYPAPGPDQASYVPHLDARFNISPARTFSASLPAQPALTPSTLIALQQYGIEPQAPAGPRASEPVAQTNDLLDLAALGLPPHAGSVSDSTEVDASAAMDAMMDTNWNEMLDSWAEDAGLNADAWNGGWDVSAPTIGHETSATPSQPAYGASAQGEGRSRLASDASTSASASGSGSRSGSGSGSSERWGSHSTSSTVPSITPPSAASESALSPASNARSTPGAFHNYSSSLRAFAAAVLSSLPTPSVLVQSILPPSTHSASKSSRPSTTSSQKTAADVKSTVHVSPQAALHLDLAHALNEAEPTAAKGMSILERRQTKKDGQQTQGGFKQELVDGAAADALGLEAMVGTVG